jgi:aryl-alcohol dehydrogenase-like predicted oxidoreductase
MSVAWVINHPGVTSAIIGPRTMEQLTSQLDAAEARLEDAILDAIDEVVPPGTNFTWADAGYATPPIASSWRRRRPRR